MCGQRMDADSLTSRSTKTHVESSSLISAKRTTGFYYRRQLFYNCRQIFNRCCLGRRPLKFSLSSVRFASTFVE